MRRADGSYFQRYTLGTLNLSTLDAEPTQIEGLVASVKVATVKCFGTDDPGGTDEPYLIVSVMSVNPYPHGLQGSSITVRTPILNDVRQGDVILV